MTSSLNRSLEKGLIAHSVVAIALSALGVFPFGFAPGIVVMGITLPPLQAIEFIFHLSDDDWRPIFFSFSQLLRRSDCLSVT
ncbi:MAG: hypothetical protein F6K28_39065 [Microcoleus sp. SIO2G3]|nr:hypothetical protein [Microcoleus sp. SIO2G3]